MPDSKPLAAGLYLVATPIGNLGDITLRALGVLRGVDLIACEDTRQTQKLLNHFEIKCRTVSYHHHNERERSAQLMQALTSGSSVAVVSDAGTPGISDPGAWLVKEAIAAGVPVIPIPGANAAVSALVASGLPADEFTFHGFLPEKAGARRTKLEDIAAEKRTAPRTVIFYEAPHRVLDTLADIASVFGNLPHAVAAREVTKLHEEFVRGTVAGVRASLSERDRVRGEFVLLIELPPRAARTGLPATSLRAPGLDPSTTNMDASGTGSSAINLGVPGPNPSSTNLGASDPGSSSTNLGAPGLDVETWEGSPDLRAHESLSTRVARLHAEEGLDEKDALKRLARAMGKSKSELYRELQRERARKK